MRRYNSNPDSTIVTSGVNSPENPDNVAPESNVTILDEKEAYEDAGNVVSRSIMEKLKLVNPGESPMVRGNVVDKDENDAVQVATQMQTKHQVSDSNGTVNTVEPVVQNLNEQNQQPATQKQNFADPNQPQQNNQQPQENELQITPEIEAHYSNIIAEKDAEIQRLTNNITVDENLMAFKDALDKNPYEAISKYMPAIFTNENSPYVFNRDKFITDKLNEIYPNGAPENYSERDAVTPGTPAFKYRTDLQRIEKEADSLVDSANNSIREQEAQSESKVREYLQPTIQTVQQRYGLSDEQFNSLVWNNVKLMNDAEKFELLVAGMIQTLKSAPNAQELFQTNVKPIVNTPAASNQNIMNESKSIDDIMMETLGRKRRTANA